MAKIFLHTSGCSFNHADSETITGILLRAHHQFVASEDEAELVILNSCTVKSNPEQRLHATMRRLSRERKKFIVAGCVPQADSANKLFSHVPVLGVNALDKVDELVNLTLAESEQAFNKELFLSSTQQDMLRFPSSRLHPFREIIPLNAGCLSSCSYCKTKDARGDLFSYDPRLIRNRFRQAINDGAKEIWLTSQDTGAYGLDRETNIARLLSLLLEKEGSFRVRLGMTNPTYVHRFQDELIKIFSHPSLFKFLHIPVQSGSNSVLRRMKRGYRVEQFVNIVKAFRKADPLITIATDIICGFPGETEKDFDETLKLIDKLEIPVVNISKFYLRPGTQAEHFEQHNSILIKKRSTALAALHKKIALRSQQPWKQWQGSVLVCEKGKNNTLIARNDWYKQIILQEGILGTFQEVKVKTVYPFDLRTF
ncbi:MAG: tRNA (N(6)-L-threonylcarbamoyladenosine(37)-C(2))-methylthiotransferase [Candidatus Woesearchaeota archaeon]|nr:MAG: tRNA (N(6)-L-threonylcarbamoyladenosine(37)-C(2))-methylthiotransferase [Candidatus Woesearchaeota archaeon]